MAFPPEEGSDRPGRPDARVTTHPQTKGRVLVFLSRPVFWLSLVLGLGLVAGWGNPASADDDKAAVAALRTEADRILKLKKSSARDRLDLVLLYAERLRQGGDTKTALRYLDKVLKLDPWRLDAHLMLAEIHKEKGEKAAAEKKAEWILEHAETDLVRSGALHILERAADTAIPNIERVPGTGVKIVLIPIGPVDVLLLKAVAELVMRHVNYPVSIQRAGLDLPPGGENPLAPWIEGLRKTFRPVLDTDAGKAALDGAGKNRGHLESDWAFLQVYRVWLEQSARWGELSDFDARLRGREQPLWPGGDMNRHLASVLGPYGRENVMYVGVTRGDMLGRSWRGAERPAFGWGGKGLGTASYGRFVAARTGGKPDWDRLVKRLAKQIICVVGSTLEVRRCTDRRCPMRVVGDLRSLDAKGLDPCKNCAEQIRGRY